MTIVLAEVHFFVHSPAQLIVVVLKFPHEQQANNKYIDASGLRVFSKAEIPLNVTPLELGENGEKVNASIQHDDEHINKNAKLPRVTLLTY